MENFRNSGLCSYYADALSALSITANPEIIETVLKINLVSQAKYLKESLTEDRDSVTLITSFPKTAQALYATLKRIRYDKDSVPDSFELSFSFDDKDISENTITSSDPEFLTTLSQVSLSMGKTMNGSLHYILSYKILEIMNSYINRCKSEGRGIEVESDGYFMLSLVHGENETNISLTPGSIVKTVIKSDDLVGVVEGETVEKTA